MRAVTEAQVALAAQLLGGEQLNEWLPSVGSVLNELLFK